MPQAVFWKRKPYDLYKQHGVRLIGSLPSFFEDQTDAQRGKGVFRMSISILKRLNSSCNSMYSTGGC